MILSDLSQVIYAPKKAFKSIVSNPKYLGAILVLVIFIALQAGYEYSQFSKTQVELTSPQAGVFQTYTNASSGYWQSSPDVLLTNNNDYFNYTLYVAGYGYIPDIYGNSSLQLAATNTQNVSAAIGNVFNVDCAANGFHNLTMILKQAEPQGVAPQSAKLTLYALGDTDYYTYDLTPYVSNQALIGQWNNITLPIGPTAQGWTPTGNPTWNNITSLKLDFTYPTAQNVTIRLSALYFRAQYVSLAEYGGYAVPFSILQAVSLQFLVSWLLITGVIFLMLKGLKAEIVWKPIFIGVGFALVIMAIRAAINLIATLALPAIYYPFDLWTGIGFTPYGALSYPQQAVGILSMEAQTAFNTAQSATAAFNTVTLALFAVAYIWLGALTTTLLGEVKPDYSIPKRAAISAVAIGVTIIVLIFLVTGSA